MKELNGFTPFNHDYLCQMLRSVSDNELANILNDVSKEQGRRAMAKKNEYLNNIRKAISDAVKAGYNIDFYYDNDSGEYHFFSIHSDNELLYDIELSTDN